MYLNRNSNKLFSDLDVRKRRAEMAMAKGPKKKLELSSEELKAKIIGVAGKHFATLGLHGTSLKDIAAEAQVAGSLINYHFKDRDGLFRACIEPAAHDRSQAIGRILADPASAEEMRVRIELFVEEMQSSIISNINFFEIMEREMRAGNPMVLKLFEETMLNSFKQVMQFFGRAIENKLLQDGLDPVILATLLFTSTCDSARKNYLAKRFFSESFEDPEYRRKYAQHVAGLFLKGVMR